MQALLFLCMPYSRSPRRNGIKLGRKKYRSAKREDDFFPADPKGPALRSGGGRLPLPQRNGGACPSEKSSAPVTSSGMKILTCSHIIRHETLCQEMTCADRSIVITIFPAFICNGATIGNGAELPDMVIPAPQATVSPDGMNLEYQYKIGM